MHQLILKTLHICQDGWEQYNRKYKEENICTPKRKLSMLQDNASHSPSLGTAQLSDQWKPACESPAKRIKLLLFD